MAVNFTLLDSALQADIHSPNQKISTFYGSGKSITTSAAALQ
jgi:hypothetical protein